MIVLGVDTSTDFLAVSAVDEKKILADYRSEGTLVHSSLLVPVVEKTVKKIGITLDEVELFAVGIGPGSFTGLRVGVTAMRAFAIATDKPIIGIPSIDAIAFNGLQYVRRKRPKMDGARICPLLDAKKGQVYAAVYTQNGRDITRSSAYILEPPARLVKRLRGEVLFLGDAAVCYKNVFLHRKGFVPYFFPGRNWHPKASVIARLALSEFQKGGGDNPYDLAPMYLYARDCNVRR